MASALERARVSTSRLRARVANASPIRTLSAFAAGALVGALEARGILPASVLGLPLKPVIGAGLHLLASNAPVGSTMNSVAGGAGDGTLGAYGYAAGKGGTLIAGDDYVGDSEDSQLGLTG